MKGNIKIILLFMLGVQALVYGQSDHKQMLQKVMDEYKNKSNYAIEVTYKMLRGLKGNNVTESYTGEVNKQNEVNRFSIRGSEIIQSSNIKLTLNHKRKVLKVEEKFDNSIQGSPVDLTTFLKYYKIANVEEDKNLLVYEMIADKNLPDISFAKIVLHIDKNVRLIKKQVLYFAKLIPFKHGNTSKLDYARLVIDLVHQNEEFTKTLSISNYVVNTEGIYKTTAQYQDYKLIEKAQ